MTDDTKDTFAKLASLAGGAMPSDHNLRWDVLCRALSLLAANEAREAEAANEAREAEAADDVDDFVAHAMACEGCREREATALKERDAAREALVVAKEAVVHLGARIALVEGERNAAHEALAKRTEERDSAMSSAMTANAAASHCMAERDRLRAEVEAMGVVASAVQSGPPYLRESEAK